MTVNGWGVGEQHWGGLAQRARMTSQWLVPLPDSISTLQAAAIGTAGYTSMLCVLALEAHGVVPASGPVVVTGAAGGVGSVAVAILAKLGYEVHAVTGRPNESDYLHVARRGRDHPPRRAQRRSPPARQDAMGGRSRRGRQPHPRQRACR